MYLRLQKIVKSILKAPSPEAVTTPDLPSPLSPQDHAAGRGYQNVLRILDKRPLYVNLETTNVCNSLCKFCAYPKAKEVKHVMSMDLFKKICSEYAEMGGGQIGFSPLLGDPLIDPHIVERMDWLQANTPSLKLYNLFTNGIAFGKFDDERLSHLLSSFRYLNISLGGFNREDYKAMFGVDAFEKVWRNLIRLGTVNQNLRQPNKRLFLHIRTMKSPEEIRKSDEFRKLMELGFNCTDISNSFVTWGDFVSEQDLPSGTTVVRKDNRQVTSPCLWPSIIMTIRATGEVNACGCRDASGITTVGDVRSSSLREIWTGKVYRDFMDTFRNQDLKPLCQSCGMYTSSESFLRQARLENYQVQDDFWDLETREL